MNRNERDWAAVRAAVKARLAELELSPAEATRTLRIPRATLLAFLDGRTRPHGFTVSVINDALGLPRGHLHEIADKKPPEGSTAMDAGTEGTPDLKTANGNLYGSYVNTNELARTLDETRVLRLALNVLYDGIDHIYAGPASTPAESRFQDVMADVHDRLADAETRALTQCGFAEHYVVIRPFSPVSLPDEGVMKEITSAVRTLQRHGMLVQAPDARDRDDEC